MADLYTKRCTLCKTVKPGTEFRSHPTTRDRLDSWCIECKNTHLREYQRRMYWENPVYREQKLAANRAADERRREAMRAAGWTPYRGRTGETWDIDHMIAVSEARNAKIVANNCSCFPVS